MLDVVLRKFSPYTEKTGWATAPASKFKIKKNYSANGKYLARNRKEK